MMSEDGDLLPADARELSLSKEDQRTNVAYFEINSATNDVSRHFLLSNEALKKLRKISGHVAPQFRPSIRLLPVLIYILLSYECFGSSTFQLVSEMSSSRI